MNDHLVRAITDSGNILGFACTTTHLVKTICHQHGTFPTATVALGRALTGGALMGALLKNDQRVVLKFEGNGPLKKILVEADSAGGVRGYVGDPKVDLPAKHGKFDIVNAIGKAGLLTVMKDLRLKEPYKGVVPLYTSEIAEDLAFYFTDSEQIPSAVGLGVFVEPSGEVSASGGFLIQSLPPADENMIASLARYIENSPPISELLRNKMSPQDILSTLFHDIPLTILATQSLAFRCTCSKPRMEQALIALGIEELTTMSSEKNGTEVICEFCRACYTFTQEDIRHLITTIQ